MKPHLLLILLPALAGAEQLPDSSRIQEDDSEAMSERFSAPAMDSQEMKSLYLESPVELGNAEDRSGMEALSDEERYRETDLLFREQQQSEQLNRRPDVPDSDPQPISPPLNAPLREL